MLSTLLIQFELVYGSFGQSNIHSTIDFCPRPARKKMYVPLHKRHYVELTVLKIYTVSEAEQLLLSLNAIEGRFLS